MIEATLTKCVGLYCLRYTIVYYEQPISRTLLLNGPEEQNTEQTSVRR